jgi:hypothetical protein
MAAWFRQIPKLIVRRTSVSVRLGFSQVFLQFGGGVRVQVVPVIGVVVVSAR